MSESKTDKVMISKLQSGKLSLISEVLKDFNEKGSVVLIPYLFELIASGKFAALEEHIIRIISDIKKEDAAGVIVDSLLKYDYKDTTAAVVAICWQSNLDFSAHLPVFIGYFLKNDYQTSIEAFTVIEESLYNATIEQRNICLKILEQNSSKVSGNFKPLFNELHKLLKSSLDLTIDPSKSTS